MKRVLFLMLIFIASLGYAGIDYDNGGGLDSNPTWTGTMSGANINASGWLKVGGTLDVTGTSTFVSSITAPNITTIQNDVNQVKIDTASLQTQISNMNTAVSEFFFTSSTSGATGYWQMLSTSTQNDSVATVSANVGGTDSVISTWTTLTTYPGVTKVKAGKWELHLTAQEVRSNNRNIKLWGDIYKKAVPSGTETFLFSTNDTPELSTSKTLYEVYTTTGEITLLATDRLVIYIHGERTSGTAGEVSALITLGGSNYNDIDLPILPIPSNLQSIQSITWADGTVQVSSPTGGGTPTGGSGLTTFYYTLGGMTQDIYSSGTATIPYDTDLIIPVGTITGIRSYSLFGSSVSAVLYNLSTSTGSAYVPTYTVVASSQLSVNLVDSDWAVINQEIATPTFLALFVTGVPASGNLPVGFGLKMRYARKE